MDNRFGKTAPVNVGDEIDVKIIALGDKGDGIAKIDGFVIVVPGTKVDDAVKIKVSKVFRNVGFGEVIGEAQESEESQDEEQPAEEQEESSEEENEELSEEDEEPQEEIKDTEDFGEELEG